MDKRFVHLHLHTDYSLLDAAIQIKPLAQKLVNLGMSACAITDHGNMYGAISFYNEMRANQIKPIIGCEVYITRGSRFEKTAPVVGEKVNYHLILLARNLEGYHNLVRLTSRAFTEGFYYKPRIDLELLAAHSKGLICLSACISGIPSYLLSRGKEEEAAKVANQFQEIFGRGNYFLEIQDHGLEIQQRIRRSLVALSKSSGIPLVATNDCHYLDPEDARAHDILLCIGTGKNINDPNRLQYGSPYFYVRSGEQMWQLFGSELPDALSRTVEIAEMCQVELPKNANHLPVFSVPAEEGLSIDEYFEKQARLGFERRTATVLEPLMAQGKLKCSLADYNERLQWEVRMIQQMEYASYFLIVWEFIKYAKERSIPVGPGRGSAAGSLVAYSLEITDIDPLEYDLFFERFLNPERVSMPDIDIDFCVRGRSEVLNHVTELYGRDAVCQIITFGTMASRAAIKDVGRALDMPYGEVERIAKLIPPPVRGRSVSIAQALEQSSALRELRENDPRIMDLIELAQRLEGCARHTSVHAAGVVISPKPLEELIPIAVSSRDELTTQYEMVDLEKTGMLKMDFLGLTALTIINDCLLSIKLHHGIGLEWPKLSLKDEATMRLFALGKTEAVFQFESRGMQEICRRLKPKDLEDLAALNALYRPGPLDGGMVDDFIERHHGTKKVRYIVPEMQDILSKTFGIIVYQEQIMQIAQRLAGYSLGDADLMRRAMGKKNREEMALHKQKFIEGALANKLNRKKAEQIFSLMEQFADYGFNRSHSVAYAYLAFQTAFLKAHYPEHFYTAVLSNEMQDTTKIFKYANELRSLGIKLLQPDVNISDIGFMPAEGAVRYGLGAIKGLGQTSVNAIVDARKNGAFKSLYDFVERLPSRAINRRVLEGLVCSGAFDSLFMNTGNEDVKPYLFRACLHKAIDTALERGTKAHREKLDGQASLFAEDPEPSGSLMDELPKAPAWTHAQLLAAEKAALGFFISGHPLDFYETEIAELGLINICDLENYENNAKVQIAGIIASVQLRTTKKNSKFAILQLEDRSGSVKCIVWPEVYARFGSLLQQESAVMISCRLDVEASGSTSLIAENIVMLSEARQSRSQIVLIKIQDSDNDEASKQIASVFKILDAHRGEREVLFDLYLKNGPIVRIRPNAALRVGASKELEQALVSAGCKVKWVNQVN